MRAGRLDIREATVADKRSILRLCRRSVRRDYVPFFLDDFLDEGGLFIALDNGRVVGMGKYTRCIGGDGWLGQGRTDPEYRRKGVATALVRACSRYGASLGAKYVRLWSLRRNTPAQIAVRSMGFKEVGTYRRMKGRIGRHKGEMCLEIERSPDVAWRLMRGSELLKESSGYAPMGNEFVKVNPAVVSEAVSAGKIARLGDNVCYVDDSAWGDKWRGPLEFAGLAGDIGLLLQESEHFAREKGKREVHTYFAVGSQSLRVARRLGYEVVDWGKEAVLFEKPVRAHR
jgi:RimJ/RimL family protein N-acetyltransferase